MAATLDSTAYSEALGTLIDYLRWQQSLGIDSIVLPMDARQRLKRLAAGSPGSPPSAPAPSRRSSSTSGAGAPGKAGANPPTREKAVAKPAKTFVPVQELPAAADRVLSPEEKEAEMAALRERALACVKCPPLANARTQVVFGVGTVHADLMFVGEAPGADEDRQGEPFVGKAGQLLTRIIQAMGLTRETVFIANVLKCRPDTPGRSWGNRKPRPDEMATCLPYLQAQIDIIQPKVLVALGATAVEGLLGKSIAISRVRGHWQSFRDVPLMPTYHPAFVLRNETHAVKRQVWEDMMAVMEILDMPISDQQRGYFLPKNG